MRTHLSGFRRRLALTALGALALRTIYVALAAPRPDGGGEPGTLLGGVFEGRGDTTFFHLTANLLADGEGFIDPFVFTDTGAEAPTALHPPLFSYVLALVSLLGGRSWVAHQLAGCALGAATVVVVGLLGRRVGGERVGLVAAAIAAVYPLMVAADGALMSEALYGLLIALTLLLGYRLLDRRDLASAAALGACVALAALTRTEALLLVPLLVLPLALRCRPRRLATLAAAGLACLALLAPWAIRNAAAFDRLLIVSSNGGTVIAGANCGPAYEGRDIGGWRFDCVSERSTGNEALQAQRWRQDGVDYARDHPGRLPLVAAVRVLRTWSLYQPRRQVAFAEGRHPRLEQAGTLAFFLLAPLAVFGALLLRRRGEPLLLLVAPALMVTAASVAGYGLSRFRYAAEIAIVVLAAVALLELVARARGGATLARGWPPARSASRS